VLEKLASEVIKKGIEYVDYKLDLRAKTIKERLRKKDDRDYKDS